MPFHVRPVRKRRRLKWEDMPVAIVRVSGATMKIKSLKVESCDDDGNRNGEITTLFCDQIHNNRPSWRMDLWHSICYVGDDIDGFWCTANLHSKTENGEATGIVFEFPEDNKQSMRGMYPPLGFWRRGRPWNRPATYPHNIAGRTCFLSMGDESDEFDDVN